MKVFYTFLVFCLLAIVAAPGNIFASQEVGLKEARAGLVKKVSEKAKVLKQDKEMQKRFKKQNAEAPIDFRTEPDRWMWFWIFTWGIALILTIIFSSTLFLPGLFWTAGLVFLVIWLVHKFS